MASSLVVSLVLGLFLLPQDEPAETPYYSRAYDVKLETKSTSTTGSGEWEFSMKMFVVPAKGDSLRYLFTIEDASSGKAPTVPLYSILGDKARPEIASSRERAVVSALRTIVIAEERNLQKRLEGLESGEERISFPDIGLGRRVPVTYVAAAQSGNEDRIEYRVSLKDVVEGRKGIALNELSDLMVFSREGHHLLGARWKRKVTQVYPSRDVVTETFLEIRDKGGEPLTEEQADDIAKEFELLHPIATAASTGFVSKDVAEELAKTIAKYKSKHAGGQLKAVLPKLEESVRGPLDPDSRARAMIGKPAPDFTLEDLEGKKFSLSQFKGNVVLLQFWSFL